MKLRELAHARTGDKGNTLNVSVICHDPAHYAHLSRELTPEAVKAWLADIVKGDVIRYALPNLAAFNFVLRDALGGGVTRSLAIDAHGKSVSSALLGMTIAAPDER
ncbi:hypothetical protein [Pararobbsia silviterrae]|uniref:AtuA-like ferredoxin-fold domain-containing protein n=1 Tax=Pararobbsia silviterrae TaxID=1792498 RepID=A0A494Y7T1_9BURK|nr:hypothetical protein [Pararobbsia silviterrae]RKP55980.1 hypothetical protein D7S86_12390 [Pararobbsia silviterrae]